MRLIRKVIFAIAFFFLSSNSDITVCAGPTDGANLDVLPNPRTSELSAPPYLSGAASSDSSFIRF